jgi:LytS/YehU family sensor histidine kinase
MSTVLEAPSTGRAAFLAALNGRAVGTAVGLAVLAAVMLNPIFQPPFSVMLGRTLFLALVLLVVFAAARAWPAAPGLHWLPSWLGPLVAVGVAAPVATVAIYLFTTGGNVRSFIFVPERVSGFFWIAGAGVVFGALAVLGAMARERVAQAKSQLLQSELERSRLEKQAVDARLSLLQAQIEPHFLFNTLANVQALVESNSPHAADVLKSLIAYLRAAMPRLHDGQPTLGNEVALVRAYLELMQMRMPDRLQFSIDVDPQSNLQRFPAMALLTLVENAVRHGVDPSEEGGRIEVGGRREGGTLKLWVADTGVGMNENAQPGTGLTNLKDRLQAFFGPGASLQLSELSPHGLRAEILIPA